MPTLPGKDVARPSILPLPDDQARSILDGVAQLELLLQPNVGNPAYPGRAREIETASQQ